MNLVEEIKALGVYKVGVINCDEVPFNPTFRQACEANSCGMYNRCWMCPPSIGDIHLLIDEAKRYKDAIVYQTVEEIEDSFDIEGMIEAGKTHNNIAQLISKYLYENSKTRDWLHLGGGACRVCENCAKQYNKPCLFPDMALSSVEAYGISVCELAPLVGMKYINGKNTVTYFGVIFFKDLVCNLKDSF